MKTKPLYLFSKELQEYIDAEKEAAFIAGWASASVIIFLVVVILHFFDVI